ncbi:Alpha N-terminal methyltransferase 1 [Lecanosticta acicola]|uniref:Alpha N-terminal protein methyltransferase 1 n=1 Tax=Lecanosticta acicola TaxID=111012 RepID=A0AAI8Z199_9PEZI|nr:Alpha N-terminal methyltransferase 1 [Lecanosticta acicola]
MSTSPSKRRFAEETDFTSSKKPKAVMNGTHEPEDTEIAVEMPIVDPSAPPDSHIDHAAAIAYWSSTPATVDGVLGGFPQVSRIDLQGSANFLAKLLRQSRHHTQAGKLRRVADCGAGIGRVSRGFLSNVAEVVDIVEPVKAFTDQVKDEPYVGKVYNVGLEKWQPEVKYDVVWNQWCVGQLTDTQLIAYLQRLPQSLTEGGWIIVKENLSNHHLGEDVFDETDSSVTRTDVKFRQLFEDANLRLVSTELQKGFPKSLYPVRAYALQPK